jgi:hypothetical protein
MASPLVEGEGGDCFHDYVRQAAGASERQKSIAWSTTKTTMIAD